MSNAPHHLDAVFIESKRRELTQLRDALRKTASASQLEEDGVRDASAEQPREFEDDAQKLDTLEKEGVLINRTAERLARVDRALAKIEAGTYGLSDVSGERIPKERLNAVPDAINTLREQEDSELAG
jgi:DnaK suppressor protein